MFQLETARATLVRALLPLVFICGVVWPALAQTTSSTVTQQLPTASNQGSVLAKLAAQNDDFLPVEQAFVFDYQQQGNNLNLRWQIKPGYYLYKDKIKLAAEASGFSHPTYPTGLAHEDAYFGKTTVYRDNLQLTVPLHSIGDDAVLKIRYQGCADAGLCYPPVTQTIPLIAKVAATNPVAASDGQDNATTTSAATPQSNSKPADVVNGLDNNNAQTPVSNDTSSAENAAPVSEQLQLLERLQQDRSLWTLGVFFLLGLGLAFTPCVFPMYPILTSIIVGQRDQQQTGQANHAGRLSFAYVQGMALTYSALGLVVAAMGVQFQAYFQHPVVLVGLSVMFVLLALSMFGVITLQLPSTWQAKINRISDQQQRGSIKGALGMGMLSGLVASPCTTAPLTGVLLYIAQTGDMAYGALVLYVLSLGMGLPLLILGLSGGKLLPKPGAWMDFVKNIFGFLLLTVPLMLLARLVDAQWILWLATAIVLGFSIFLFHAAQQLLQGVVRAISNAIAVILLCMLCLYHWQAGSWSWLLPTPQAWQTTAASPTPQATAADPAATVTASQAQWIKVASVSDVERELALAKANGEWVMLDFYADWCVACKEFESITFVDPTVQQHLKQMRLLKFDVTEVNDENAAFMDKHQVLGLPTLMIMAPNGDEVTQSRITGFMPPAQFSQHLAKLAMQ